MAEYLSDDSRFILAKDIGYIELKYGKITTNSRRYKNGLDHGNAESD